jgi:DEAD/DEAH box helicase domain-containing protein
VHAARPGYYTQPRVLTGIHLSSTRRARPLGAGRLQLGTVRVTSQVTGYLRRDEVTGDVWDETPLEMSEHTLITDAVWWTIDPRLLPDLTVAQLAGGAHAAEHTLLGLLPMFAPCDRWDIGGLSTAQHAENGLLTVFVHDGQAGGGGFAARGFEVADDWVRASAERVQSCGCEAGCPACVVSPSCGTANQVLDKGAGVALLRLLSPST